MNSFLIFTILFLVINEVLSEKSPFAPKPIGYGELGSRFKTTTVNPSLNNNANSPSTSTNAVNNQNNGDTGNRVNLNQPQNGQSFQNAQFVPNNQFYQTTCFVNSMTGQIFAQNSNQMFTQVGQFSPQQTNSGQSSNNQINLQNNQMNPQNFQSAQNVPISQATASRIQVPANRVQATTTTDSNLLFLEQLDDNQKPFWLLNREYIANANNNRDKYYNTNGLSNVGSF